MKTNLAPRIFKDTVTSRASQTYQPITVMSKRAGQPGGFVANLSQPCEPVGKLTKEAAMKRVGCMLAVLTCLALASGPVQAQWEGEGNSGGGEVMPLTLQDMSGLSKVELSLPMLPGDDYFGLAPMLYLQYGAGSYSLGLAAPMAFVAPDADNVDSKFDFGNLTVDAKGRACSGGDFTLCYGGSLALGFGFIEISENEEALMEMVAHTIGIVAHQDWTYHIFETLVIRPLAVLSLSKEGFYAQVDFGPPIMVPLFDSDNRDVEVGMMYQFGMGYRIAMIMPMLEFRGFSLLTEDNVDSQFWLNIGARLDIDGILPVFRITIPMSDASKADADIQFEFGVAARF